MVGRQVQALPTIRIGRSSLIIQLQGHFNGGRNSVEVVEQQKKQP